METNICRSRFTSIDIHFIVEKLAECGQKASALQKLCEDPESINVMMDLEPVHQAIIDTTSCVGISPAFYFYVLTRRELLRRGLDDRNLCDYIAAMLTDFSRQQNIADVEVQKGRKTFLHLSDLLLHIEKAPAQQRYSLRKFVADYALFLSGMFKENANMQRHGAPGIQFYEQIGRVSYRAAAHQPQAKAEGVQELLEQLAELFQEVRLALNSMADRSLHWDCPV